MRWTTLQRIDTAGGWRMGRPCLLDVKYLVSALKCSEIPDLAYLKSALIIILDLLRVISDGYGSDRPTFWLIAYRTASCPPSEALYAGDCDSGK